MIAWWWQSVWIGLYVGGVLAIAQWLANHRTANEYTRKFVHIATGNIILLAWMLQVTRPVALGFGLLFCAVTLLSYRYRFLGSLSGVNRRSFGTFFYALSISLLVACFWYPDRKIVAVLGILVMTWGDALAALVGQSLGRRTYKVLGVRKTLEGSLTMAAVSFVVALLLVGITCGWGGSTIFGAGTIAVVAAALEVISVGGVDNLTVPVGSAILANILLYECLLPGR
ncbi:diacylglycerol/polyprenol kinase family protein [Gloeobacter kilaueensis]|uniref:Phosphatidate cytidylyltransferase n=1 Tax=Gloeobacter kilaueensis (strain ATCC BAA-2537 / CCAP 1431/1 / ULC 316 / JS1) TaxID=1183438 RepID=U5QH48_GLOK1|nr:diacylglycerol/polyprenol kinase family protein [Gloeobacter kilaueensis]AGY56970.1 phosphatidate cytidylyltransferase [Gloeobacter kilaueensis JS1]